MTKRQLRRQQRRLKWQALNADSAARCASNYGGFKLTREALMGHAERVNPSHKTYTLRVCGDRGNSNSGRVTVTPPLETQRLLRPDYRVGTGRHKPGLCAQVIA